MERTGPETWSTRNVAVPSMRIGADDVLYDVHGDWAPAIDAGFCAVPPEQGLTCSAVLAPEARRVVASVADHGGQASILLECGTASAYIERQTVSNDAGPAVYIQWWQGTAAHLGSAGAILQAVADHSPITIEVTDADGILEYVNPHFERATGYSADEVLGKRAGVEASGLTPSDTYKDLWATIRDGKTWTGAFHNRSRDGRIYVEDGIVTPISAPDGSIQRIVAVQVDRTEEYRVTEALKASEEQFRALFDSNRDAIYIHEIDGTIRDANLAASRMIGVERTALPGRSMTDIDPDYDVQVLRNYLERGGSETLVVVAKHHRPDGTSIAAEVRVSPISIDGESLFIAAAHDVTERQAADLALRTALEENEVLLREVHHRVKNNLQTVTSLLALEHAKITDGIEVDVGSVMGQVSSRVQAMSEVHELLYRSDRPSMIDVGELLEEIVSQTVSSMDVASPGIQYEVHGDPVRLRLESAVPIALAVNEMVINSVKHAWTPDFESPRIRVETRTLGDGFEVSVADNGIGCVDFEDSDSGLGFALVSALCKQLGAKFRANVPSGGGCSISMSVRS